MKNNTLIEAFENLAPLSMAEPWDNSGLLLGSSQKEIKSVYIALDATDQVVNEAVNKKVDLLLTHHPLLFKPLKSITNHDFIGRRIMKLIKEDITYYAMHTNFDVAIMADLAAQYLNLNNQEILEKTDETHGIGKIGLLPYEMTLQELCNYIKDNFNIETVKVFGDSNNKLRKIAIMPGSGKSYIQNSIQAQVDVMITGDIDHHEGIDAVASGLIIIDAGHYGIEHIFVRYMQEFINNRFHDVIVYIEESYDPFKMM